MYDNYFREFLKRKEYDHFKYNYNSNIPKWLQFLDKEPIYTTENFDIAYDANEEIPLRDVMCYLYHGIRFQKHLEKLENIFQKQQILAGKYIEGYYNYEDNCNMGEYVSLLQWIGDDTAEYQRFIIPNISLIVSPRCNAIRTQYVEFTKWDEIRKGNYDLKNLYSYMQGECLCKDSISFEMVKAIGVSYNNYNLIDDIKKLMSKYNINIPIVETSEHNKILIPQNNN